MGGHGGLNILPQKRWNVYNRDNRLKVAQDEAKQRQAEEEAQQRHAKAESEHRHALLLQRARARQGAVQGSGGVDESAADVAVVTAVVQQGSEQGKMQHINFFEEEEAAEKHPEVEKEKADELRRRGNPEFFTSDARFDERFQLGFGMGKEQPWYARRLPSSSSAATAPSDQLLTGAAPSTAAREWALPPSQCTAPKQGASTLQLSVDPSVPDRHKHKTSSKKKRREDKKRKDSGKKRRKKRESDRGRRRSDSGSDSGSDADGGSSDESSDSGSDDSESSRSVGEKGSSKHGNKRKLTKSKERKKDKKAKYQQLDKYAGASSKVKVKSIEELRLERLHREQQERSKAREVLFGKLDGQPRSGSGQAKRYHSGFGNAPPPKKVSHM